MAKPPWQEPDGFTESTQGEHTRARRQCVLKIADLHTGACYEGYI